MLLSCGLNRLQVSKAAHRCRASSITRVTVAFGYPRIWSTGEITMREIPLVCRAAAESVQDAAAAGVAANAAAGAQEVLPYDGNVPPPADTTLYISNLDPQVTQDSLQEAMQGQAGLEKVLLLRKQRGRMQLAGFAQFNSAEAASAALQALNGSSLAGRKMLVRPHWKNKRKQQSADDETQDNGSGKKAAPSSKTQHIAAQDTLVVINLPWSTVDEDLQQHFAGCAGLQDAFVTQMRDGRPSGIGFVRFDSPKAAAAAAEAMNGTELDGRQLRVKVTRKGRVESNSSDSGSSAGSPSAAAQTDAEERSSSAPGATEGDAAAAAAAAAPDTRVAFQNLPPAFTYREVYGMCCVFGDVRKAVLYGKNRKGAAASDAAGDQSGHEAAAAPSPQAGKQPGAVAFMADRAAAEKVVAALNGLKVQGCELSVRHYKPRKVQKKKAKQDQDQDQDQETE